MLWQGSPVWPKLNKNWLIGWVLEAEGGQIVGCIANIPLLYHFRGEPLIAASARGWVVGPNHRGRYAIRLFSEHLYQSGIDLCISTTVGPMAMACSDRFAQRIPAGDWETIAYCVTGYREFAMRALRKLKVPFPRALSPFAGATLRLKDATFGKHLRNTRTPFAIEVTDRFDSRFDAFWKELVRQKADTLLAARDSATLSWHFSRAMRRNGIWILTASRSGRLRAYGVFMRQGSGDELSRARLVDYQTIEPDVDLLPQLLSFALRRCAAENVSIIDRPGVGLAKMRAFDEFASYRRKQTWPFFYRANDPALAAELTSPTVWDPSEYDGDASL